MSFYYKTYSDADLRTIWNKGHVIAGLDPAYWRNDDFSRRMFFPDYGKREAVFGWEVDHIVTVEAGGSNAMYNLRPLHYISNLNRNRS